MLLDAGVLERLNFSDMTPPRRIAKRQILVSAHEDGSSEGRPKPTLPNCTADHLQE